MNKKHIGANKKRTNTPALNRRRVVAYRHEKYVPKNTDESTLLVNTSKSVVLESDNLLKDTKKDVKKSKKGSKRLKSKQKEKNGKYVAKLDSDKKQSKKKGKKTTSKKTTDDKTTKETKSSKNKKQQPKKSEEVIVENVEEVVDVKEENNEIVEEVVKETTLENTEAKEENKFDEVKEKVGAATVAIGATTTKYWDKVKTSFTNFKNEKFKRDSDEPVTIKSIAKNGVQLFKERHNSFLDYIIDEPRANVINMIFSPGSAVKKVASAEGITLNVLALLFMNFMRWLAFGSFFAYGLNLFINNSAFSIARMNFSGTAKITFLIAIFALAMEYAAYNVISLYCGIFRDKVSASKLTDIAGRASLFLTILYAISAVLLGPSPILGIGLFIATCIIGIMLKIYGITIRVNLSMSKLIPIFVLCVVISTILFSKYVPLFSKDLIKIFETILNI